MSVLVTLLILLASGSKERASLTEDTSPRAGETYLPLSPEQRPEAAYLPEDSPTFNDFLFPENDRSQYSTGLLLRDKHEYWSDEEVARFWIPLDEIALDILIEENNRKVREIFKDIP